MHLDPWKKHPAVTDANEEVMRNYLRTLISELKDEGVFPLANFTLSDILFLSDEHRSCLQKIFSAASTSSADLISAFAEANYLPFLDNMGMIVSIYFHLHFVIQFYVILTYNCISMMF